MARFVSLETALVVCVEGLSALLCAIAATGLLYLLRPAVSGLKVEDALPLDELPRHAGVSIILFALVWGGVGVWAVIGTRRRWGWRLVAFAGALWLWEVLGTTISLAVVRQEGIPAASFTALTIPAVYLAPLFVATAAVSTARLVAGRARSPNALESQTFSAR